MFGVWQVGWLWLSSMCSQPYSFQTSLTAIPIPKINIYFIKWKRKQQATRKKKSSCTSSYTHESSFPTGKNPVRPPHKCCGKKNAINPLSCFLGLRWCLQSCRWRSWKRGISYLQSRSFNQFKESHLPFFIPISLPRTVVVASSPTVLSSSPVYVRAFFVSELILLWERFGLVGVWIHSGGRKVGCKGSNRRAE